MSRPNAARPSVAWSAIRAPEFPPGADWLNTAAPLSLRGLRGKIVLLDFWTYGCINCIHVLPDLTLLERKYSNELIVISVHSAKFKNEEEVENVRNAVLRYNIEHPVVIDSGMMLWDAYAVRAWPTLVLIDSKGGVVGKVSGEGNYDLLDRSIDQLVQQGRDAGGLDSTPLNFALEAGKLRRTSLRYPGKVLADPDGNHLFVADSSNNRIVIAKRSGEVEAVAGSGVIGLEDGAFRDAKFSFPQGMASRLNPDGSKTLYVADTNNHAIRALDLRRGLVTTIAGTGHQARWNHTGGKNTATDLSSPWDLLLLGEIIFIAMAGLHQIWAMNLQTSRVELYAGSGREARLDGSFAAAAFAQPSGLASDGQNIFVADSESNIIRVVDLRPSGDQVRTLAGGDLFDFGDRDGLGDSARFQHPMGLTYRDGGILYIVDTYNHKVKTLEIATGRVSTFLGGGRGDRDGDKPQFYEPGGLSLADDVIYVADTNNHRVRIVDLRTRSVSTLSLRGLIACEASHVVDRPLPGKQGD